MADENSSDKSILILCSSARGTSSFIFRKGHRREEKSERSMASLSTVVELCCQPLLRSMTITSSIIFSHSLEHRTALWMPSSLKM